MLGTAATLGVIGGGALLGAVAGGMTDKATQNYTSGVRLGPASVLEHQGTKMVGNAANQFDAMVQAGPGQSDVTAGTGAQRDLAAMFGQYAQQGGADPTAADISSSNGLAQQLFQAQRTQMGQAFQDQNVNAGRSAALMGRSANDPILAAKLGQEQTRQSAMLGAQQGSWATQYAMQQPMQRLDMAGQRAGILGGLATQAMANRQALAAMGEGIQTNERNFRLQTAQRYGTQSSESGGGLKGAITGAMAGAGALAGIAGGFGGIAAGGAGAAAGGAGRSMASAAPTMGNMFSAPMQGPTIPSGYLQTSQGWQMPSTQMSPYVQAPQQQGLFSSLWSGAQNYHNGMVNHYSGGR